MSQSSKNFSSESGFIPVIVLIAVVAITSVLVASTVRTTTVYGKDGGDSTDQNQQSEDGNPLPQPTQQLGDNQDHGGSGPNKPLQVNLQSEGSKQEAEIQGSGGQHVHIKIEDNGVLKMEAEGATKLNFINENGQTKVVAEDSSGKEVKLNPTQLDQAENGVKSELAKDGIELSTDSAKPVIAKNKIAAVSQFPLSVNVATNQLIVTTPAGQKVVATLPDAAVQNLLTRNIINKLTVTGEASSSATGVGQVNGVVSLQDLNNQLVYKVDGEKTYKVFGFIPVSTPVTAFVSADSGSVVSTDQSVIANLLKLLSPQ